MVNLSNIIFDMGMHMQSYLEMYIRDFFISYQLNKKTPTTMNKFSTYEEYFYKGIDNEDVKKLFVGMKNKKNIYDNLISYLQQFCEYFSLALFKMFPESNGVRCHFRRFYLSENKSLLYITFCQGSSLNENNKPPDIRDIDYTSSLIECSFLSKSALVYSHNVDYNRLDVKEWDNFITIVPGFNKNKVSYEEQCH